MNRESVGAVDVAVVICPRRELLTRSMKLFRVAACGCVILKEYESFQFCCCQNCL